MFVAFVVLTCLPLNKHGEWMSNYSVFGDDGVLGFADVVSKTLDALRKNRCHENSAAKV